MKKVNIAVKRNTSSTQVLKTLQILLQGDYTMSELIEKLNMNEKEPVFNHSVVSKYINTCRYCGINIIQIQGKYYVASIPFGMNLSSEELELFNKLDLTAQNQLSPKDSKAFLKVIKTISAYSNKEIIRVHEKTANLTLKTFKNAIEENLKIKLILKDKSEIVCVPLSAEVKNETLFLKVYENKEEKYYTLNKISGLEVLNEKFNDAELQQTSVFKLYGGLSKRYQIKDGEEVFADYSPEYKTVINRGEGKNALISRLLRYDSLCEIIKPKEYRDEMIKIINDTLANYGVE